MMTIDSQASDLRFHEIEHKFVVDDTFDVAQFDSALNALHPTRTAALQVRDTYYLTTESRAGRFVIRHRFDHELHHLTLKSLEKDAQVRQEINIDLGHHRGDQREAVDAFLQRLGLDWHGSLQKDLRVWYFPDAEIVSYTASTATRSVRCVEFEATKKDSVDEALDIVARYEQATGFDRAQRSLRSLLQLLFPEVDDRLS